MTRSAFAALHFLAFASAVLAGIAPAGGAELWEAAANGAAVILPKPAKASGIVGGSLFCRESRWGFLLRTARTAPAGAKARIEAGDETFSGVVEPSAGTLVIDVPKRLVNLLKDGAGMSIAIGKGKEGLSARFSLAGSRAAIETAAPHCSSPDMAGFEAVALRPDGPAAGAARPLMAEELELFVENTIGAVPVLSAAILAGEGGRELLFASLCGSIRYYGESGCKLMGFASETGGGWRPVYDTEGMPLYRDPRSAHAGWPDLMTLPGDGPRLRWAWDGGEYKVADDPALADAQRAAVDGLRTGATAAE